MNLQKAIEVLGPAIAKWGARTPTKSSSPVEGLAAILGQEQLDNGVHWK